MTAGGGVYALSVDLDVDGTRFDLNTASSGAGLASDCAPEICVGDLPRDTCGTQSTNVTAVVFAANVAAEDGGGAYVSNQAFRIASPGTSFGANVATRGASVFAEPSVVVLVDGLPAAESDATEVMVSDSNNATAYGPGFASPVAAATWHAGPAVADSSMSGSNLCTSACVATLADAYGNAPTLPTVVEIVTAGGAAAMVDGPRYVLVTGGFSEPIPSLAVRLVGDATTLPSAATSLVGLQYVGAANVSTPLEVTSTRCRDGYGAVASPDGSLGCAPCGGGTYSDGDSWATCSACATGTTTPPGATGATQCEWCDAGHGWDAAAGACVACVVGTYSNNASRMVPCEFCGAGLTTNGTGATACAIPAAENVDELVIIITVVVAVVCVVAVIASCIRKADARHGAIGTVLLSVSHCPPVVGLV